MYMSIASRCVLYCMGCGLLRFQWRNIFFKRTFFQLCIFIFYFSTNVVMNYTEIEGKVREATNDEPWGPTGPLMQELAHSTFTYEHFPEVMSMLWKRMLQDNKTNWRRTYKVIIINKVFQHLMPLQNSDRFQWSMNPFTRLGATFVGIYHRYGWVF